MKHRSPWIFQMDHGRPLIPLRSDLETDVVIVGAGIAGVSTAYFILKETDKRVVILERGKLAHGATGHNAGQLASYFERPFFELVEEFGIEAAAAAQASIEGAWEILDSMYTEAGLSVPLSRFLGHAGFTTYDQIIRHLKDNQCRKRAGLRTEEFRIALSAPFINTIPKEFEGLYEVVPHEVVLSMLQIENKDYVAVLSYQKGCLNSALFSEEIVEYLQTKYPDRFALYEHAPVRKIALHDNTAILDADRHTVTSKKVVLCTNGFDAVHVLNEGGLEIDLKLHHLVKGMVGYMSAYIDPTSKPPMAISYFPPTNTNTSDPYSEDPYFYVTRRQFDIDNLENANLISVGGPEFSLDDRMQYDSDLDYPEEEKARIDAFVKATYESDPRKKVDYQFTWHGLMGYTPSGVRVVGEEPRNRALLYNLGCNGVGILPSLYGAKRIGEILSGKKVEKTIFDPKQ